MIPKVSVIMSVYNGEKYLREAMDSILNQTFTDFEFIIINDGSTDHTKQILESYTDSRIRLFHQKNIGLTKSLNKGLRVANGEYIARQDADDISELDRINQEVSFLDNNSEIALIGTYVNFINEHGKKFDVWKPARRHQDIKKGLTKGNCFCHGSVMFRKKCLSVVGEYREFFKYTQDYDFWVRISEKYKVANLNSFLYQFRRYPKAISRKSLSEQLDFHLLVIQLAKEREKKGSDDLKNIKNSTPISLLKHYYKIDRRRIKKFKSTHFLKYSKEALSTNNYTDAARLWLKAFFLEPQKWKIRFFVKQLLNTLIRQV